MTNHSSGSAAPLTTPQLSGEPANGTVPFPIRNNRNNSWRLVLRLYRQHPILWVVWVIGASWLLHQVFSPFRGQVASTAAGAVNLVRAVELCKLHNGRVLLFGTEPQNHVENGITCGFPTRMGVQSLLNEYAARNQVVLYSIEPYAKTTN